MSRTAVLRAPWRRFRPSGMLPLMAILLGFCGFAAEPEIPATLGDLQARLSNHVAQAKFSAGMWGVKIASVDSGKVLFEHNAQKLFSPASNSKLYTVALALDRLGEDYRIKTSLYARQRPTASGILKGDLIVYGRGDPTINARVHGGDIYQALQPLVSALTNAGVKRITGDLVGDDSFIQGPEFGSGWAWDDMGYYYGAEISALTINDNTLELLALPGERVGAPCRLSVNPATTFLVLSNRTETVEQGGRRRITLFRPLDQNVVYISGQLPLGDAVYKDDLTFHNPAGLFVSFLKAALARQGIKVSGKLRTVNWLDPEKAKPSDLVELGAVESLPMREIAREVQKPSQNLYTDLLLAHVGETKRTAQTRGSETSEDLGIAELSRFLAETGVRKGDVFFEEGSGLSRNNLTTPNASVALLTYMSRHKAAQAYLDALPIAGVDGTLKNRMKGTPAAGNVRAKTGTLRWANSLSGFVTTAGGERLVFSIMLNRYHNANPNVSARSELDAIAILLASFSGKCE